MRALEAEWRRVGKTAAIDGREMALGRPRRAGDDGDGRRATGVR